MAAHTSLLVITKQSGAFVVYGLFRCTRNDDNGWYIMTCGVFVIASESKAIHKPCFMLNKKIL